MHLDFRKLFFAKSARLLSVAGLLCIFTLYLFLSLSVRGMGNPGLRLQLSANEASSGSAGHFSFCKSGPSLPVLPEAMETEETETLDNEDFSRDPATFHQADLALSRQAFCRSLRVRLVQLTSSVLQHPRVPFFILHHSWKSFPA